MNIQTIKNVSDCVPLFLPHSLYLKPNARINISVSLPPTVPGKTISNWDIMEKLRQIILPDVFSVLKVVKSTLEFIRFEAEIDDREKLRNVLARIDGRSIKLSSFAEAAKVRATETKEDFPTRHDWDVFFRDTRDMDEMKPGERPDTIHFSNLPIRWFCPRHLENTENVKPSENIFKRIFEKFGEVRYVDIPICDPYRSQMKSHMSGIKTFNFDDELCFEGYVQFSEYISFVRAMDSFRGMKLIRKDGDKNSAVNIQVTFDRSKHLSDMSIKRRAIIRERLITKDKEKEEEEKVKLQREEEQQAVERRKQETIKQAELDKQHAREERRKEKQLRKLREKEEHEMNSKIRCEEKKLLIAQRKLESIRLLEALFERMRTKSQPDLSTVKNESKRNSKKAEKKKSKDKSLGKFDLRNKLVKKFKNVQEQELEKQKEKLQKTRDGKSILTKVLHDRSPSINTISSNDSILSDKNVKKKKKKKKKKRGSDSSSSSSSSSESEPEKNAVAKLGAGMMMQPQGFPMQPMFNPETGEWVFGGMGMYPYPQFFPPAAMAGGFFPNPMMYRGYRGGARGRFPRGRGRGVYSRGGNNSFENDSYQRYSKRDNEDYSNQHDNRRSKSRSPSHSYSKSRYRRSHSHRRSQSYSRSRSRSRSKKLVSTLRRTRSKSSSGWSTPTRRRKSRSWSSRSRSRSRTPRKSRSRERNDSKSSKHHSAVRLETEEIVKEAKRIQQSVERKLKKRDPASDKVNKSPKEKTKRDKTPPEESHTPPKIRKERSVSRKRSASVDSSRFVSPKRKSKNTSPGKVWE